MYSYRLGLAWCRCGGSRQIIPGGSHGGFRGSSLLVSGFLPLRFPGFPCNGFWGASWRLGGLNGGWGYKVLVSPGFPSRFPGFLLDGFPGGSPHGKYQGYLMEPHPLPGLT